MGSSVAHSSPGAICMSNARALLNLKLSLSWAAYSRLMERCQAPIRASARSRTAGRPRRRSTLSDCDVPAQRQRDQLRRTPPATRGRRPLALGAEDEHAPARGSRAQVGHGALGGGRAVAPAAGVLGGGEEVGDVAHAGDRQVLDGARRRLADRRRDLGRRGARGSRRRRRPTHSAVRQIAPRFCGSWTSSSATMSGAGAREQRGRVRVRVRVGLGARRPGGRRCPRARGDLLRARPRGRSTSRSHGSRAAPLVRGPTRWHAPPARPAAPRRRVAPVEDAARRSRASQRARARARRRSRAPASPARPARRAGGRPRRSRGPRGPASRRSSSSWAPASGPPSAPRGVEQVVEAEDREHLAQVVASRRRLAAVGLADPVPDRGQRRRAC